MSMACIRRCWMGLHVLGLVDGGIAHAQRRFVLLPFEWSEVTLVATGARELRVRASVERGGDGEALARLQLADGSGRAVARIGGLRLREASEAQIREAARSEAQHLYRLEWRAGGVERGRTGSAAADCRRRRRAGGEAGS